MKTSGSVIVSWSFETGEDVAVLIVGRQENNKVEVINAFQGEEAMDICKKLTVRKENKND